MTLKDLFDPASNSIDSLDLQKLGEEILIDKASSIVNQYARSKYLYLLIDGEVSFSIKIKDEPEDLVVGVSSALFTPVGWSGFKEPFRYATTVRTTKTSKFLRFQYNEILELFEQNPAMGSTFLQGIGQKAFQLLLETRSILANLVPVAQQSFLELNTIDTVENETVADVFETLQKSPFFELFNEQELFQLSDIAKIKAIKRGEKLFKQGDSVQHLSLLLQGKMALIHSLNNSKKQLDKRMVADEGYLLSIEGTIEQSSHTETCVALKAGYVLTISLEKLSNLFKTEKNLSFNFYRRMLWYISVRLRSARAKLIRVNFEGEISAVKHIIEQHASQLNVLSEIHKVPILLSNTITLKDAIQSLDKLKSKGNSLEKRLARTSLDMLSEVIKENDFYRGLARIYSAIVEAPSIFTPEENRNLCAESFCDLFERVGFQLKGVENLPKEPSIFIYNHLENHIFNTLPNNFQLTLDSHFISSVILYRYLGNPGIRVVRVPKGEEFGHQLYYEKLGHIPVYTKDSEELIETPQQKKSRRNSFYEEAAEYLDKGTSILLAPEGQSFTTEQSPGDFKAGAFVLAAKLAKEPLIVPISVANFDKRLNRTVYAASIHKPFRLSEKVKDPTDRDEMNAFLKQLKKEYKDHITETSKVDNSNAWTHLL